MALGRRQVTLVRRTGAYTDGVWSETSTNITILASVQPASGADMEPLPEGRRNTRTVKLYTDTPLKTSSEGVQADRVIVSGVTYEVVMVGEYQSNIISHYKALAQAE